MIKTFLAGAALCGVLPAFAAADLGADATFESASLRDDRTDAGGASPDVLSVLAVQEPATLAMMGAGLLGLIGVGWRRSRR